VLIMLVPIALGLASLVQALERKGFVVAGGLIALLCLAEQGVTTETFDAVANRALIAAIASRIDRDGIAFYYHACDDRPFAHYQTDAMWASLASGVPTINGYSGYAPPGWEGFFTADLDPEIKLEDVLRGWEQARGLSPDRVQAIGLDCPGKNPARSAMVSTGSQVSAWPLGRIYPPRRLVIEVSAQPIP
jgi:hypothetical protein